MSTSYLPNSRNLQIGDLTVNHYEARSLGSDRAFKNLQDNMTLEAIHNSDERCDAPKCHPETRTAVQEEILSWITHGDSDTEPKRILWVTGPAGTGKTAIAGSIAEICEDRGILAGSFFFSSFSRSEKRKSKRFLVGTLAYGLLQHDGLQPLRGSILSAIKRDPAIFRKRLRDQCKVLLLKPFYDARNHLDLSSLPQVIIIDGLDEVEAANSRQLGQHEARMANEADQIEILSALLQAASDVNFPFRILIVSRPERAIREFFSNNVNHVSRELFLDNKYDPDADITLFLNAKFAEIRRRYGLPLSWPSQGDIKRLVVTASGQFIYAATVVRFLQDSRLPDPQDRLRTVLSLHFEEAGSNPFAPLDALYTRVLMSSPDPLLAIRWLGAIYHRLGSTPALFVKQLLQDFEGQADHLLENLASLIEIPPAHESHKSPYNFYHKTLSDFLDSERCGRDFRNAFDPQLTYDFVDGFLTHVLKAKSPKIALRSETDRQLFLRHWFRVLAPPGDEFHPEDIDKTPTESLLSAYDVGWLVHALTTTFWTDPKDAQYIVEQFFHGIHEWCPGERLDGCRDACRHWRANILRSCEALGWKTPDAVTLLYDMIPAAHPVVPGDAFEDFKHPNVGFVTQDPPSTQDLPAMIYNGVYENYKALCDLVDKASSRLPDNWKCEYTTNVLRQETEASAVLKFTAHIEETKRELGLDVRYVDRGGEGEEESPGCGRQVGDEEHDVDSSQEEGEDSDEADSGAPQGPEGSDDEGDANAAQGQAESDKDSATLPVAPPPHYAPRPIPLCFEAYDLRIQGVSVPTPFSWSSTIAGPSVNYGETESLEATAWTGLLDVPPPLDTPPLRDSAPPTPTPETLEAIRRRAARSGIQLSLWVDGVGPQWCTPR